jgi:hypothetical protein
MGRRNLFRFDLNGFIDGQQNARADEDLPRLRFIAKARLDRTEPVSGSAP